MEHIIFDVKLESGFTYKARFIEDSHKLDIPPLMEYESVISRDVVRIVLIMAYINGLDVNGTNIQNACVNSKPK